MKLFNGFGNKGNDKNEQDTFADEQNIEEYEEVEDDYSIPPNQDNVVDFRAAVAGFSNGEQNIPSELNKPMRVVIVEPTSYDDVQQIANHLKSAKPILLNFERTDAETATRIIDFMSGVTYALDGAINRVGDNIFLCSPKNVNVSVADIHTPTSGKGSDRLPWE